MSRVFLLLPTWALLQSFMVPLQAPTVRLGRKTMLYETVTVPQLFKSGGVGFIVGLLLASVLWPLNASVGLLGGTLGFLTHRTILWFGRYVVVWTEIQMTAWCDRAMEKNGIAEPHRQKLIARIRKL